MKPLIIFGIGEFAAMMLYYFSEEAGREVTAFTADAQYIREDTFCGLPVVPFHEVQDSFPPSENEMSVAIGYSRRNALRASKYTEAKLKGYTLANYIHPTNVMPHGFAPGDNCIILENNVFQPFTRIGCNNVIFICNAIAHHVAIADHVFISGQAIVGGCSTIGDRTFIGVGAVVRDRVSIAPGTVIGAGAVVLQDTAPESTHKAAVASLLDIPPEKRSRIP